MKSRLAHRHLVLMIGLMWLSDTPLSAAQTIEQSMPILARALAEQLVEKNNHKVTALDFTDLQGNHSTLGQFLAEQLSVEMVSAEGITVIDRAHLDAILDELELTEEGLVDPTNQKKLGKAKGVDAILFGTLTIMSAEVLLTVKAVSTETFEVVAAGRVKFMLTNDVRRMLGLSVSSSNASTSEGREPISPSTVVAVGPINAMVKDVSYGLEAEGNVRHPQIQVVLALENPSRDSFVAISMYSLPSILQRVKVRSVSVGEIMGVLKEASGKKWGIKNLEGIPFVYCFVATPDYYSGGAPFVMPIAASSVAECVGSGAEYRGGDIGQLLSQNRSNVRAWSGGVASIEPGGKLEITTSFVSERATGSSSGLSGSRHSISDPSYVWPKAVQLSLDLIVGTHQAGQLPERAKDLSLKSLVIGRIVLPN